MNISGLNILFIDDELYKMLAIIALLESRGAKVTQISDASSAWEHLKQKGPSYGLIILDIMMSSGNLISTEDRGRSTGIELLKIIRGNLKLRTPIIVSSVISDPELINSLFSVEQLPMVHKPYLFKQLVDSIKAL